MSWLREADEEPIPGYRLIKPLGSGGFGEVWLCEAPGKILKAIKFVFGNLDASASGDGRARQEFGALQRVKEVRHPFVLSIERIDILDGEVAIVMELAEKSLHDVFQEARNQKLPGIPREQLLAYLTDAADGLDYLSETHNLMHMDVKPRNLFVVGNRVKVADFGLAKHLERHSSSGVLAGITPQYAAPETFTSRITKSSDQYSLAIVYAELLTGKRPFLGKTIRELALQHMNIEPNLSALPERDREIVARALSKNPETRFPNCKAFVATLCGLPMGFASLPMISLPPSGAEYEEDVYVNTPATQMFKSVDAAELRYTVPSSPQPLPKVSPDLDLDPAPTLPPMPSGFEELPEAVPVAETPNDLGEPVQDTPDEEQSQRVNFDFPEVEGGILRPTVLVGMGNFGLLALRELRSRLTDRLGDLEHIPILRFLYIDTDPDAKTRGITGSPDRSLTAEQVFPTPLQPITRYRRTAIEQLTEWLPREKLHAIPRTLQAQGTRALGRLAFTENYLRFITRLQRELEIAGHPESLSRSADHAGLIVRDVRPRVFVIVGAGGSSSGALIDVGYALNKLMEKLKLPTETVAYLYMGAPADPTTPPEECANIFATLTELNHYADPSITFRAQYGGPDGPEVCSKEKPFSSVYLLQRGGRSPSAAAECAERLAAYLTVDLTSPVGKQLDDVRANSKPEDMFRGFGTGGVWFPRGLLLRASARQLCERLLHRWQASASAVAPGVAEICHKALTDPHLVPEQITNQIQRTVATGDSSPREWIVGLLHTLENKINASDTVPATWSREAFEQTMALLGVKSSLEQADALRTGKITRLYTAAGNTVADAWIRKLSQDAFSMMEQPGKRVAAAEAVLARLIEYFDRAENEALRHADEHLRRSEQAYAQARLAADACASGGGFSLFGSKDSRNMRALLSALTHYANCRQTEEEHAGIVRFMRRVKAGLEDKQRDLTICRQRLTQLRRVLEQPETAGASICGGPSPTVEILLPDGGEEIEWAAKRFVETVSATDIDKLDQTLQVLVLEPKGGLYSSCQKSGGYIEEIAPHLVDQAAAFLGTLLPFQEVTDFHQLRGEEWDSRLRRALDRAMPTVVGTHPQERRFVLLPDTEGAAPIAQIISRIYPGTQVVPVPRSNEIAFCREVRLRLDDVRETVKDCRQVYETASRRVTASPHARFDLIEWVPLDV